MKVATAQFEHRANEIGYNLELVKRFTTQAANQGCELIAFPECCLTGYWHLRKLKRQDLIRLSEALDEYNVFSELQSVAIEHNILIGVGHVEYDDELDKLFNSYSLIGSDGVLGRHRKLHCFISKHLECGDQYTVFALPNGRKCGILICYDNNLIENVRAVALAGAEILIAPHQTGGCHSGSPHAMGLVDSELWRNRRQFPEAIEAELRGEKGREWLMRWLPARAHDNGLFLIFSNGIGRDDDEIRTGNAMLIDPYGRIIEETCHAGDAIVIGDLNFALQATSTGRRWLRARRPELYGILTDQSERPQSTRDVRFEHLPKEER